MKTATMLGAVRGVLGPEKDPVKVCVPFKMLEDLYLCNTNAAPFGPFKSYMALFLTPM
jgi:hypothetical protein